MLITNSGRLLLGFNIAFIIICGIVLGLRYWAAKIIRRQIYFDDYLIPFAYLNVLVFAGLILWMVPNGVGAHMFQLDNAQVAVMRKVFAAGVIPWVFATGSVKISIIWLYLRLFTKRNFKPWAWTLMGVSILYLVVFMSILVTNCVPFSQAWDPTPSGHCRTLSWPMLVSVSINMVIDILIVLLPMPWLWNLQMELKKKVFVTLMFGIGFLTVGTMIWRIQMTITSFSATDFSHSLTKVALISELEVWLGFIAANMPNIAPLATQRVKSLNMPRFNPVRSWNLRKMLVRRKSGVADSDKSSSFINIKQRGVDEKGSNTYRGRQFSISVDALPGAQTSSTTLTGTNPANTILVKHDFSVQACSEDTSNSSTRCPW